MSFSHCSSIRASRQTELPWMASPFLTVALGARRRMSASLRPRPLPSWVQKGQMVLPEQSKASKR